MKKDKNSLIRIEEIKIGIEENETELENKIIEILGVEKKEIIKYFIVKRAIDSRNKRRIFFVYSVDVEINESEEYIRKIHELSIDLKCKIKRHKVRLFEPYIYNIKTVPFNVSLRRPLIVGSGPSGIFCALLLAKSGLKPLLVERGRDVDSRVRDVDVFFKEGKLSPLSNIQFGEGGAGAFSDGKLYTMVNNPRTKYIFDELIKFGAPKEIAWDAKPHIGTDKLRTVVKNIRKEIIRLGGLVRFETCLTDIEVKNNRIVNAILNDKDRVAVNDLIVAIGHSARDTYKMLYDKELEIQVKPFSIGLRIEHKAEMINKSQFGEFHNHSKLPTADYKLVVHIPKKRSVYTFCMCPGGYVVGASSEEGGLVVNGMSLYNRDGVNSNSALLVNVLPADFGSDHPLAGIEFQRKWENKAFLIGGSNYHAPVQLVGDFLNNKASVRIGDVNPTCKPGITLTSLGGCLPDYVIDSIRSALPLFERKIKGISSPEAVLTGVETRSSSPVRILRDDKFQSNIRGIYPTGEGAGYAGGIVSSAIDGLKVGEVIIEKYLKN